MRRVCTAIAALVVATSLLASPAVAGDPPISLPSSPQGLRGPVDLPSAVDPASPYLPQVSCSPATWPAC